MVLDAGMEDVFAQGDEKMVTLVVRRAVKIGGFGDELPVTGDVFIGQRERGFAVGHEVHLVGRRGVPQGNPPVKRPGHERRIHQRRQ